MSTAANVTIFHYRFATPITGADHEAYTLVGTEDTSYEIALDTGYCLILKGGNTGDMSANSDIQLQYNVDGAGWNNVNATSSYVRSAASGDTEATTSTTERLGTSARTFAASVLDEVEGLISQNLAGGTDSELYFAITFRSADFSGGETVTFRVTSADTLSNDVTATATVPVIAKTAGGTADLETLTASGSAKLIKKITTTAALLAVTASGSALLAPKVHLNTTETLTGATEMTVTSWNTAGTSITFSDPGGGPIGTLKLGVESRNTGGGDSNTGWTDVTVAASRPASGTADLSVLTASGTAAKVAGGVKTATGTATLETTTASGIAGFAQSAGGTATLDTLTASAAVTQTYKLSGTATLETLTASGNATAGTALTVSDTVALETLTASAAVTQTYKPSGTATLETLTASGNATAGTALTVSDTVALETLTASAAVTQTYKPSGTATLETLTASGTASFVQDASGTATLETLTASGTVLAGSVYTASGTASLDTFTASGTVLAGSVYTASGTATLDTLTASAAVTQTYKPSGAATLETLTASGTASFVQDASGTATLETLTASGTVLAGSVYTASGTATLDTFTAFAAVTQTYKPSGTAVLETLTASGTASFVQEAGGTATLETLTASGNITAGTGIIVSDAVALETLTASAAVTQTYKPSGTATLETLTASGTASFVQDASGTATLETLTASGNATAGTALTVSDTVALETLTASAAVTQTYKPSGTATLETLTASGNATAGTGVIVSDTVALETLTASAAVTQIYKPSGTATLETLTASGVIGRKHLVQNTKKPLNDGWATDDLSDWYNNSFVGPLSATWWSVQTVDGPAGNSALQVTDNVTGSETCLSESIQIVPGHRYRVSVHARQLSGDRVNYFEVAFFDQAGSRINSTSSPVSDAQSWPYGVFYGHYWGRNGQVIPSDWTFYSHEFGGSAAATVPSNAVTMRIGGYFTSTGTTESTVQIQDLYITDTHTHGVIPTLTASGTATASTTLTVSDTATLETLTASGTASFVHDAGGTATLETLTASGTATTGTVLAVSDSVALETLTAISTTVLAPKVYLNSTQTLVGATELPVSAWSSTSITFDDVSGAPTGSLYLGVENRNTSEVGWIAVTVTANTFVATGNSPVPELTATGLAGINASLAGGTASVPPVAATGEIAFAPKVYLNTTQTLAGATELQVNEWSTSSIIFEDAVGPPTGNLYLGVENRNNTLTSWIPVFVSTLSVVPASGNATTPTITAASASLLGPRIWLNTSESLVGATQMTTTGFSSDGTTATFSDPVGSPVGSLFLGIENRQTGNVGWTAVTVNVGGAVAVGSTDLETITATGIVNNFRGTASTPAINNIAASGIVNNFRGVASTPSIGIITATSAINLGEPVVTGEAALNLITASGVVVGPVPKIDANSYLETLTASGTLMLVGPREALGTANLNTVTSSGVGGSFGPRYTTGTPTIPAIGVIAAITKRSVPNDSRISFVPAKDLNPGIVVETQSDVRHENRVATLDREYRISYVYDDDEA